LRTSSLGSFGHCPKGFFISIFKSL
jgi:hypothetical protein